MNKAAAKERKKKKNALVSQQLEYPRSLIRTFWNNYMAYELRCGVLLACPLSENDVAFFSLC